MGKRSRKRGATIAPPPRPDVTSPGSASPRRVDRRARLDEAPKAPWSPFPLVELCILISLVLIVLGFLNHGPKRPVLLGAGFCLVILSSLELSIREHFSGFRSHSALLSGFCAVVSCVPLFTLTGLPRIAVLITGAAIFAGGFYLFRRAFARRTGGLGFRA